MFVCALARRAASLSVWRWEDLLGRRREEKVMQGHRGALTAGLRMIGISGLGLIVRVGLVERCRGGVGGCR